MTTILILFISIFGLILGVASYIGSKMQNIRIREMIRTVTAYKTIEERENFITSLEWFRQNPDKVTIEQLVRMDHRLARMKLNTDKLSFRIKELEEDNKKAREGNSLHCGAFFGLLYEKEDNEKLCKMSFDDTLALVRAYKDKNDKRIGVQPKQ